MGEFWFLKIFKEFLEVPTPFYFSTRTLKKEKSWEDNVAKNKKQNVFRELNATNAFFKKKKKMGFTIYKIEIPLRDMKLQEKEA